jgi:3'-phosphoadenosine 5'-phosphosulfate sulfotransferase (PAPS reductase)/FAD synthetase
MRILNNIKHFTVLWSGGKDSTAALLWTLDHVAHKEWNVLYVEMTGNTHPLCNEYVLKTAERLGISDRLKIVKTPDFFDFMQKWGPPLMLQYRWCLYRLKFKAFENAYPVNVDGIKKADSRMRKNLELINRIRKFKALAISPLIEWRSEEVLDFIKDHGVDLNPCYKRYGHGGNCMFCPYHNKLQIMLTMSDPEWRTKISSALKPHKEKLLKGPIGAKIYKKWFEWPKQTCLLF